MYRAAENRYEQMQYRRCGRSGLRLPAISLGLWQNFGERDSFSNARTMILRAFDLGITHFDLANNYGPPPGAAEETMGRLLSTDLAPYRDELIISSKAGYTMWPGPYGDWGSKKYIVASLEQSLKRLGLDYVDIFYHHRPDPETPLEETMAALALLVRQGKALYIGLSNYRLPECKAALAILKEYKTPCLIHQPRYSLLERWVEDGLQDVLEAEGVGSIAFSPLAQGLLTDKYLQGIPADSRAAGYSVFLNKEQITEEKLVKIRALQAVAMERRQSLAQMALAWVLRHNRVTSALIGASKVAQVEDCVKALQHLEFSERELAAIDAILQTCYTKGRGDAK